MMFYSLLGQNPIRIYISWYSYIALIRKRKKKLDVETKRNETNKMMRKKQSRSRPYIRINLCYKLEDEHIERDLLLSMSKRLVWFECNFDDFLSYKQKKKKTNAPNLHMILISSNMNVISHWNYRCNFMWLPHRMNWKKKIIWKNDGAKILNSYLNTLFKDSLSSQ